MNLYIEHHRTLRCSAGRVVISYGGFPANADVGAEKNEGSPWSDVEYGRAADLAPNLLLAGPSPGENDRIKG